MSWRGKHPSNFNRIKSCNMSNEYNIGKAMDDRMHLAQAALNVSPNDKDKSLKVRSKWEGRSDPPLSLSPSSRIPLAH